MIYLNLLPPTEKKQYRLASLERLVNYYIFVILGIILLLAMVLVGAKYFLIWRANIFEDIVAREITTELGQEINGFEKKIEGANQLLKLIQQINSQRVEWTRVFYDFSTIVPEGIILDSLFYKKDTKEFSLAGKADKRDEFLKFLEKLEQSPNFTEIDSSLSNLVKKENFKFQITFKLEIQ